MQQTTPSDADPYPADVLINLIVTLLAPVFIAAAGSDIGRARDAALQTLASYQARSHASLIKVANIIAFGLATLGSLSLSMGDDLPVPLVLKLRGNAVALDRSTDRNQRALKALQAEAATGSHGPGFDEAEVHASVAEARQRAAACQAEAPAAAPCDEPAPMLPAARAPAPQAEPAPVPRDPRPSAGQEHSCESQRARSQRARSQRQSAAGPNPSGPDPSGPSQRADPSAAQSQWVQSQWAAAMAQVAAEEMQAAANLPPAQRKAHTARAAILSSTANTLLCGGPGSPGAGEDLPGLMRLRTG